jgi:hypothetical protein
MFAFLPRAPEGSREQAEIESTKNGRCVLPTPRRSTQARFAQISDTQTLESSWLKHGTGQSESIEGQAKKVILLLSVLFLVQK